MMLSAHTAISSWLSAQTSSIIYLGDKNYTGMNIPGFLVWVMSSSVESAFILYVHLYTHTCVRMNLVHAFVHTYMCSYESCTCICTHMHVFVRTIVTSNASEKAHIRNDPFECDNDFLNVFFFTFLHDVTKKLYDLPHYLCDLPHLSHMYAI